MPSGTAGRQLNSAVKLELRLIVATAPGHAAAPVCGSLSYVSRLPFKCFEMPESLVCDKPS